jgi:alpha/beta superfamily hydrolase
MREEKIFIPSGVIQLEGLMSTDEALSFDKGGAIFCHPHPQYGGDMHNLVITTAVEAAFKKVFTVRLISEGREWRIVRRRIEEKMLFVLEYFSRRLK